MTLQEIFDKVYLGLESQNWQKSIDKDASKTFDICVYRGAGLKCAAGHLIPDELYNENMEGFAFNQESEFQKVYDELNLDSKAVEFVVKLQEFHDSYKYMKVAFEDFAKALNLTLPTSKDA